MSAKTIETVKQLRAQGMARRAIAQRTGLDLATVCYLLSHA